MTRRSYKGSSQPTTLSAPISNSDLAATVADGSTLPDGASFPFVLTLDLNQVAEEKVLVASRSGNNLTITTRGYDGTTATGHDAGASVRHTLSAVDLDEANAHINATTGAHAATAISYAGSTNLVATTVEAALDELDSEKIAVALVDAKGDLIVGSAADTVIRKAVGANDTVLTADSTQAGGVKWATPSSTAEEAWHTVGGGGEPAFAAGCSTPGGGYQPLQFKKVGNEIRVRGAFTATSGLFTFPSGYRPPLPILVPLVDSFGVSTMVQVLATGVATVLAAVNTAGLSFSFWVD